MESNAGMKKAALLESEEEEERKGGREKSFELGSPKQPRERKKKKKKRQQSVCNTSAWVWFILCEISVGCKKKEKKKQPWMAHLHLTPTDRCAFLNKTSLKL